MTLETIVFATDFTPQAGLAMQHAKRLAQRSGSRLVLSHTVQTRLAEGTRTLDIPEVAMDSTRDYRSLAELKEKLEKLQDQLSEQGLTSSVALVSGAPIAGIQCVAGDLDADLIVMGSHGRKGISRLVLGSISEKVAKNASCDVLVVHEGTPKTGYSHILVPTDLRDLKGKALGRALELVEDGGTVEMMHCLLLVGGPAPYLSVVGRSQRERAKKWAEDEGLKLLKNFRREGVTLKFTTMETDPRRGIKSRLTIDDFDLVVMESHSRWRLGSITVSTIRNVACSVYVTHS